MKSATRVIFNVDDTCQALRVSGRLRVRNTTRTETLIERQELRVRQLCAREDESGEYTAETRRNIELLEKMYTALLKTRQELGLDPAILTPDEERLKAKLEELVKQGKVTVEEVYTWEALSYRIENDGKQPYED
jgi:phosphoketolase